jgi:hypothetical protein
MMGDSASAVLRAARRITPRDRWIIRMLHEHTVLLTTHLARLGFDTLRAAQLRLRTLHALGVVERWQPFQRYGSAPMHHVLGPLGARILAAEEGVDLAALGYRRDRALGHAHRLTLTHDLGAASLLTDLATDPDLVMGRWWSARRCTRYFGHHTRPDAYATLTQAGIRDTAPRHPAHRSAPPGPQPPTSATPGWSWGGWGFFLEYDTGTTALRVLAAKLDGYHRLAVATTLPTPVLFWITRPGREPGARAALTHAHRHLTHPHLVPVLTGTPQPSGDPADEHPTGQVWLPLTGTHPVGRPGAGSPRWRLADLATPAPPGHPGPAGPARSDPRLRPPDTDPLHPPATGRVVDLPDPPPHPPSTPPAQRTPRTERSTGTGRTSGTGRTQSW